jgi:hypothetical protein
LAAAVVALVVYRGSVADKRRAQATKVSCYLKSHLVYPPGQPMVRGVVLVHDGAEHVVSDFPQGGLTYAAKVMRLVLPLFNLSDEQLSHLEILIVDSNGKPVYDLGPQGIVAPRTERTIEWDVPNYWRIPNKAHALIRFTDATGRHWERREDRPLKKLRRIPVEVPGLRGPDSVGEQIAEQEEQAGSQVDGK